LIFVLSTNQGFCGPFPQLLAKTAHSIIEQNPGAYVEVFGKKGASLAKNHEQRLDSKRPHFGQDIQLFTKGLCKLITEYVTLFNVRNIYIVSGEYKNAITQKAKITKIFPIEFENKKPPAYLDIDGEKIKFLEEIFKKYIQETVKALSTEHLIAEFSARVITMDNSVKNAKDMSENLGILYNRMRQDKITQELTEIISSTECV
jgi:F-type H+-transporting ATPase subunit gamma